MSQRPVPPRGMRDLLPSEVLQRRHLLERIIPAYERYGFQQIETPALESIDRLLGSEGGDNEKLVYKVLKRGIVEWPPASEGEAVDLGLRYDLTVPLARFYATHSASLLTPFKAIQAGPVWRAERPQKGRYRQFVQCDIDVIGDASVAAEIELLSGGVEALAATGLEGFVVRINDRRLLDALSDWAGFTIEQRPAVYVELDKVDKVGVEAVGENLSMIDATAGPKLTDVLAKVVGVRGFDETLALLPMSADAVIDDLRTIERGVLASVPFAIEVQLDVTLVRGQGYYTGAIFEIEHPASSGSLGGGGRYDRMIGKLSGVDAPAVGFSIGFERVWDVLGTSLVDDDAVRIVLLHAPDAPLDDVARTAQALRAANEGAVVRRDAAAKNRGSQLQRLADAGFTHWATFEVATPVPALQPISRAGNGPGTPSKEGSR